MNKTLYALEKIGWGSEDYRHNCPRYCWTQIKDEPHRCAIPQKKGRNYRICGFFNCLRVRWLAVKGEKPLTQEALNNFLKSGEWKKVTPEQIDDLK